MKRLMMYYRVGGIRSMLFALLGKLLNKQFVVLVYPPGLKHAVSLRIPSSDAPTYLEVFHLKEYEFPEPIQPQTILDAGANVGLAAVYFASRFPEATILAIEPERSNFDLLEEQVRNYSNIVPLNCALWTSDEPVILSDPGLGKWAFETSGELHSLNSDICPVATVQGRSIPSIMREHSLATIDLLKLDIEGAECEVLENSQAWINCVKFIVAELHEPRKKGCERAYSRATSEFKRHWRYGGHVYAARN